MHMKGRVSWVMKAVACSCCFYGANTFAGSTAYSLIKEIQMSTNSIYVRLDTTHVSNINLCPNWDGWFILYNATTSLNSFELAKSSTALAARVSGKKVSIISNSCNLGYNNLDGLVLEGL